MADLLVDAASLRQVSAQVTAAAQSARLDETVMQAGAGVLGSADVVSALNDAGVQQKVCAGAVADSLQQAGSVPAEAATELVGADASLARAF